MADDGPPGHEPAGEDESGGADGRRAATAPADATDERMRRALRAVRREGWKAAVVYAAVDAVAAFLAVNLVVALLGPSGLPADVPVPSSVTAPVGDALGRSLSGATVPTGVLVGGGAALLVAAGEVGLRTRRPLVEQFEAVNPPVAEALRTARDAMDADADSRMVRRLYADVLDRLRESSGVALVDGRRVAATTVLVVVLSLATLQVAVADVALLADGPGEPRTDAGDRERERNFTGLEDGDAVLGDSENVSAGDENLTAGIESSGGDEEVDRDRQFPSSGPAGGGNGSIESQQAGFAAPEQVEDAALVREYNLRIRESEDDE
ncbi:DUF7502 family protein [Haloarcula litorea]|uniref:DUF7502 family protein n=1 Tax=Haloarcula litorea TaxID=3032579 RepID=UPI0023E800AF|nr:hypothetical protein [Halomicroarcula sp. GDY20]